MFKEFKTVKYLSLKLHIWESLLPLSQIKRVMKISSDSQYREYKRAVEVLIEKGIKLGDMELLSGYKKRMDVENIKQKEAVQKLGISV